LANPLFLENYKNITNIPSSMEYDLELEKAVEVINSKKAKTVCIQIPDGLKKESTRIADFLREKTDAGIMIWAGSCFGSCDTPELKDVDLLIQWGHSEWKMK